MPDQLDKFTSAKTGTRMLQPLSHALWFLFNVAACEAMANLLKIRQK